MNEPLLTFVGLSKEIGVPVRMLRVWKDQRKIPHIKMGHRTVLFDRRKVIAAIERFEVKAI